MIGACPNAQAENRHASRIRDIILLSTSQYTPAAPFFAAALRVRGRLPDGPRRNVTRQIHARNLHEVGDDWRKGDGAAARPPTRLRDLRQPGSDESRDREFAVSHARRTIPQTAVNDAVYRGRAD